MQQSSALAMAPPLSHALPAPARPPLTVATRVSGRELHVVLDAFRAVLALIAMLLVLEVRSDYQGALELATRAYAVYAAILLLLRFQGVRLVQLAAVHWLDAVWCLLLFALAGGGNGFFILLFFPVLFAAVRVGLLHSVGMATTCAAVAGVILSTHAAESDWLRIVAMPAALLVLGPMTALLAHVEAQVQRGYSFGSELVNALDARRGVEAIARRALELTAARFSCDRALLALQTRDGSVRVFQYGPDAARDRIDCGCGPRRLCGAACDIKRAEHLLRIGVGLAAAPAVLCFRFAHRCWHANAHRRSSVCCAGQPARTRECRSGAGRTTRLDRRLAAAWPR